VALRRDANGELEVLVIHRSKYDDWSLPKGKAEAGETDEECAVREVEEETGLRCRLGAELPSVRYTDRFDRPKVVRYWLLEPMSGEAAPANEVDEIAWLPLQAATSTLSYERDRDVLAAAVAAVAAAAKASNPTVRR
jgi:8-oxo-dGTP diphosphatase